MSTYKLQPVGREVARRYRFRSGAVHGEGLVTPVYAFSVNGEALRPGVDRFAVDYAWVVARPELWRPCLGAQDRDTAAAMRSLYERAEAELTGTPASASTRHELDLGHEDTGGLRLPTGPVPRLRLPR